MDKLVFSCFLLGGLTPDPGPTDSCALNAYCAAGLTNVGCNPPPVTGGPTCDGKSAEVLELIASDQTYILSHLNQFRNSYGSGQFANPANRMFKLQWDENLATQAGHNARSCTIARDACRNTADYRDVGQMINYYTGQPQTLRPLPNERKINNIMLGKMAFYHFFNGDASFSSYSASSNAENEANILNDRSTKVGCALMQWVENGDTLIVNLVCNFSANVIEGQPVYTPAATAGVGCTTRDTTYPNLCVA